MRTSKLLNKKYFSIIFFLLSLLCSINVHSEEKPVDIWNLEKKEKNPAKNSSEPTSSTQELSLIHI